MTGVTRGDGTEGGEEGKGERGEEEGKLLQTGRTDGIEGSKRGPRGPKNTTTSDVVNICERKTILYPRNCLMHN